MQQLFTEAHGGAVEALGTEDLVDATAPDHGERLRADLDGLAVDLVRATAAPRPDELVVRVAVRRARTAVGGGPEVLTVDEQDLERAPGGGKLVEGQVVGSRARRHRPEPTPGEADGGRASRAG